MLAVKRSVTLILPQALAGTWICSFVHVSISFYFLKKYYLYFNCNLVNKQNSKGKELNK